MCSFSGKWELKPLAGEENMSSAVGGDLLSFGSDLFQSEYSLLWGLPQPYLLPAGWKMNVLSSPVSLPLWDLSSFSNIEVFSRTAVSS